MRYVVQKELIVSNLNKMRTHCPTAEVICVIKGNGYGLGLIPMAKLLCENGVQTLAVSRLDEAVSLRENGIDERLKEYAVSLEQSGLIELALEQEQVWDILMECFDEIACPFRFCNRYQRLRELYS